MAIFSGVMSACFSYGLAAGDPIKTIALAHGTGALWQGLPVLIVVLLGGFTTNFVWCVLLNVRNRTGYQYFSPARCAAPSPRRENERRSSKIPSTRRARKRWKAVRSFARDAFVDGDARVPLVRNYVFCALAGVTWYLQFFFYTMGESQMGKYGFSSWTLHMASIIIFSTLWGIGLHEWKGSSTRTKTLLAAGLALLILSTVVIGYGNHLAANS